MASKTGIKPDDKLPRFQMSEVGGTGLRITSGQVLEEIKRELQFPESILTYKQMGYDAVIASALNYYEHMMLKAKFKIKPHALANEEQQKYVDYLDEMFEDMEHSWQDFVQEVSSMNTYGFCVNEIVLRKRLHSKGSKYNDGLIGIRKLPIRAQDSIRTWDYSEDGQLQSLTQKVPKIGKRGKVLMSHAGEEIVLPRKKFLLFRLGKKKDSPVGESPLKACYYAWKFKNSAEEMEAVGLQRDLSGVPIAWIPPQVMDKDADPELKAQYEMFKNIVRNVSNSQQTGMVLPQMYDDRGNPLFKFELLKNDGGKAYDTSKIKEYYSNCILTALSADLLKMGQTSTGSYALGNIKTTLSAIAIEAKLKEVCNVLNLHLFPLIAEMNGWDKTRLPYIEIDDLENTSIEEFSKFVQRTASTGLLPITPEVVNRVLEVGGFDLLPKDTILEDVLPPSTSRSGDGMKSSGDGTSTDPTNIDGNDNNLDNTA